MFLLLHISLVWYWTVICKTACSYDGYFLIDSVFFCVLCKWKSMSIWTSKETFLLWLLTFRFPNFFIFVINLTHSFFFIRKMIDNILRVWHLILRVSFSSAQSRNYHHGQQRMVQLLNINIHHLGTAKHNYGVLNMTLDRFLGSFTFNDTKIDTKISPFQDKQQ